MPSFMVENRKPPPDLGRFRNCLRFIWNPEEGKFLDRKAGHWAILLLFYVFFMSCVGGLLFLMTWLAVMNIARYSAPWFQMTESRIGSSPGVGFRPVLHLTSPLIWYKWTENEISYRDYVKEMDRFFKVYRESNVKDYTDCSKEILPRQRSKPCYFNLTELKDCTPPAYGYEELSPCVYIKLNKIYGWTPHCYNETSDLPDDMPRYLRNYITAYLGGDVNKMNAVWLSCSGFYPADAQHMGEVDIYPGPGFQAAYFPYTGQEGYMSPLVALKFREPMRDTLITVRCRAWAYNIDGGAEDGGPVEFQLMIGSKNLNITA